MPVKNSKKVTVNGVSIELFYISTLAYSLGRSDQTVRKWEISGVLPNTCFRDNYNRRMYSQEQIDIIVSVAEECSIKQGASIANTNFSTKVHKLLQEHNKRYKKEPVKSLSHS